jgi:hypothetical protein
MQHLPALTKAAALGKLTYIDIVEENLENYTYATTKHY